MGYWFKRNKPEVGDLWGGLSAAFVILPQAMALGVALWSLLGGDVATGALVGLIAAAAFSFSSGIIGGTCGMVSSPTGPTLVLLGGTVVSLQAAGLQSELIPQALVIILLLTGFFQILIGLSNGGRLIKFIPYPVVAGFMTGSALLMILSQLEPAIGSDFNTFFDSWLILPLITTAITYAAMSYVPRWLPHIPGTVAGLVCGIVVFYLLSWASSGEILTHWIVGELPAASSIEVGISAEIFNLIPWSIVIAASLALSVLASLDTLLTSVVADVTTGERHNARQELVGQGVGQILSGLAGGMSGAGTTGASVVAINSGGRYWVAFITGVTFILLVFFIGPYAAYLPLSVLAGIILHVAINGIIERNIPAWLRRKTTRTDGMIAVLVTGVTVAYDLMIAVGIGVLIAVFQFVHEQIKVPMIRSRSTVAQRSSLRRRPERERDLLAEHGEKIIRYELQGNLFFGTVDLLFSEIVKDLDRPAWVIFDMARVNQVDLTAAKLFQQMAARLESHGGELIFTTVRQGKGLGRKVGKTFRKINPHSSTVKVKTFIDADESLEYAENALLASLGEAKPLTELIVSVDEIELFKDLSQEQLNALTQVLRVEIHPAGNTLFHSGEFGDELFIIIRGEVDVTLPYGSRHYKRLATFGPGTFFGEVCFLHAGKRTADARVTEETELYVLNKASFEQLQQHSPAAAISILTALGEALSEHLRWADTELQRVIE